MLFDVVVHYRYYAFRSFVVGYVLFALRLLFVVVTTVPVCYVGCCCYSFVVVDVRVDCSRFVHVRFLFHVTLPTFVTHSFGYISCVCLRFVYPVRCLRLVVHAFGTFPVAFYITFVLPFTFVVVVTLFAFVPYPLFYDFRYVVPLRCCVYVTLRSFYTLLVTFTLRLFRLFDTFTAFAFHMV